MLPDPTFVRSIRSRVYPGTRGRSRRASGFTVLEIMFAMAILAIILGFLAPYIQRIVRREKLRSAVREMYAIVLAARMQAVKRNQQVVVFFDLPNHQVLSWVDNIPYTYANENTEPLLANYTAPSYVYFQYSPGGATDDGNAVSFDTYAANAAFKDMIVFRGDGTLLPPQDGDSIAPKRPGAYTAAVPSGSIDCNPGGFCRGVYISDSATGGSDNDHSTFRISVDDFGASGRGSLLKWLPDTEGANAGENNFVPPPWKWPN